MGCSGCGQQGAVGCLAGGRQSGLLESEWTACPEQDTWTKIWDWFSIGPQPEPNLVLIKASWSTVVCFHPLPICPHPQTRTHPFPLLAHLWLCAPWILALFAITLPSTSQQTGTVLTTLSSPWPLMLCLMVVIFWVIKVWCGPGCLELLFSVLLSLSKHRDLTTTKINSLCWPFDWSCLYDAFSLHC